MALLTGVLLPLAYSFAGERRYARAAYQRAVAMEIVDGEIEVLAAGEWRNYPAGTHEYHVASLAAANLPPGHFLLSINEQKVQLEWRPDRQQHGAGAVIREVHRQ